MNQQPSKMTALLLLGPTGSGKTPLGDLIQERGLGHERCLHFDFGENLRQVVEENRPDDEVAAVRKKLLLFRERTAPLVDHYRARGKQIRTVTVDSTTRPVDVWNRLDEPV